MNLIENLSKYRMLFVVAIIAGIIQTILFHLTITQIYPTAYITIDYLFAIFAGYFIASRKISFYLVPIMAIFYSVIVSITAIAYNILFAVVFFTSLLVPTLILSTIAYFVVKILIRASSYSKEFLKKTKEIQQPIKISQASIIKEPRIAIKKSALPSWLKRESRINLLEAAKLILFNPKKLFEAVGNDSPIVTIIFLSPLILVGAVGLLLGKSYFSSSLAATPFTMLIGIGIHLLFYVIVPFVCMIILAVMKVKNNAATVYNPIIYSITFAYAFAVAELVFIPLSSIAGMAFLMKILTTLIRSLIVLWGFTVAVKGLSQLNKISGSKGAMVLIAGIAIGALIIGAIMQSTTYAYRATFEKSELLKEQTLKKIERIYGSDVAEAIAKLAGTMAEEDADAFMHYSPRFAAEFYKEAPAVAKIAERYSLELDGEAAESLAKITKNYGEETAKSFAEFINQYDREKRRAVISKIWERCNDLSIAGEISSIADCALEKIKELVESTTAEQEKAVQDAQVK